MAMPKKILNFKKTWQHKNIHIVGVTSAEGSSILELLTKLDFKKITGHDICSVNQIRQKYFLTHRKISEEKKQKKFVKFKKALKKITLKLGNSYLDSIEKADLIFLSQAWFKYKENKKLFKIKKIPFWSITKLYFDLCPGRIIGVTGTLGKGTTASLIYNILKTASKGASFAGNESWQSQVAEILPDFKKDDFLVLEVSNRQLMSDFSQNPFISVITNIYPDHLDEHKNFSNYVKTKFKITSLQKRKDFLVLNYDNKICQEFGKKTKASVVYFSVKKDTIFSPHLKLKLSNVRSRLIASSPLQGYHNRENLMAASTVAKILKIKEKDIKEAILKFTTLPGRIEFIARIHGVSYYYDIKSTTPTATLAALKSFDQKVILISGGEDKNLEYSSLSYEINRNVKLLILLKSTGAEKIKEKISLKNLIEAKSLFQATLQAQKIAKPGDIVFLSPASAFFYSKFIKKKKRFIEILSSLSLKDDH